MASKYFEAVTVCGLLRLYIDEWVNSVHHRHEPSNQRKNCVNERRKAERVLLQALLSSSVYTLPT